MSATFNDGFDTDQSEGTTIPYSGTWNPPSSRQLVSSGAPASISSSMLNLTIGVVGSFDPTLAYSFTLPQDLSNIGSFTLQNVNFSTSGSLTVTVFNNGNNLGQGNVSSNGNLVVFVSPPSSSSNELLFTFASGDGSVSSLSIQGIISSVACIAYDSDIALVCGSKVKIQDLQRGDEINGGKVARVIRNHLSAESLVEAIILEKHSLGPNLPYQKTIVCSDHYLVYQGKRRLARSLIAFPGVRFVQNAAQNVLPRAEDNNYYFYDIQFDHEGEYVVNGLTSQSRSPYAFASPLPEEFYFNKDNYRKVRVKNTLTDQPEISYKYLLPNGQEVESLVLLKKS
nr:hypothetical protein Cduv_276 [Cedratvirus duvanny]